jgi:hypothetical protein
MVKRLNLATRAFGAEPGIPGVADLAAWIAEHRGTTADIITYQLDRSLAPGGNFMPAVFFQRSPVSRIGSLPGNSMLIFLDLLKMQPVSLCRKKAHGVLFPHRMSWEFPIGTTTTGTNGQMRSAVRFVL